MSETHAPARRSAPMIVPWPEGAAERERCGRDGIACLLVVRPGVPIPVVGDGEDWIRSTADERDVAARLQALGRAPRVPGPSMAPVVPAGLGVDERRVAARLLASVGSLVITADLPVDDAGPTIASLRPLLAGAGWEVHVVGAVGYLVERMEPGS